ncbi:MAG: hypothetical protein ACYCSQ_00565 [bacterium]
MKKKALLFFVLALFAVSVSGCAEGSGNDRIASQSNQTLSRKIVKGTTTESQIKQMFGSPAKTSFAANGDLIWQYNYQTSHYTATAYIPIVNLFTKDMKGHNKSLAILFNKKGIVKNYAFSNSANSISAGF